MWPFSTSTTIPSGMRRRSVTSTLRSLPSGLTESRRPPLASMKYTRPLLLADALVSFGADDIKFLSVCVHPIGERESRPSVLRRASQGEQSEQEPVALFGEVVDRVAAGFSQDALGDLLFQLGCELGIAEVLPPCGHRTRKMLHEVMDTSLATA